MHAPVEGLVRRRGVGPDKELGAPYVMGERYEV